MKIWWPRSQSKILVEEQRDREHTLRIWGLRAGQFDHKLGHLDLRMRGERCAGEFQKAGNSKHVWLLTCKPGIRRARTMPAARESRSLAEFVGVCCCAIGSEEFTSRRRRRRRAAGRSRSREAATASSRAPCKNTRAESHVALEWTALPPPTQLRSTLRSRTPIHVAIPICHITRDVEFSVFSILTCSERMGCSAFPTARTARKPQSSRIAAARMSRPNEVWLEARAIEIIYPLF